MIDHVVFALTRTIQMEGIMGRKNAKGSTEAPMETEALVPVEAVEAEAPAVEAAPVQVEDVPAVKPAKVHKKPKSTAKGLLLSADLAKERAAQRVYDVKEAASILNLHVMTVRKAIKDKKLVAARCGHAYRISANDLDMYYKTCGGSGLFTK